MVGTQQLWRWACDAHLLAVGARAAFFSAVAADDKHLHEPITCEQQHTQQQGQQQASGTGVCAPTADACGLRVRAPSRWL